MFTTKPLTKDLSFSTTQVCLQYTCLLTEEPATEPAAISL